MADGRGAAPYSLRRYYRPGSVERLTDAVAVEEPLEIRLSFWFKDARRIEPLAVTMRTPGDDRELLAGYVFSEGLATECSHIEAIRPLGVGETSNEWLIELSPAADAALWQTARPSVVLSSCGLCGKRALEALPPALRIRPDELRVRAADVFAWPDLVRAAQQGFEWTGGSHAAALFTGTGELVSLFEDVGRHNALDKLIGQRFLAGELPLSGCTLFMSSRGSYELVQKALAAGASVLATVGAPSSLAVDLARDRGLTLLGFVRERHFNVYAHEWRISQ